MRYAKLSCTEFILVIYSNTTQLTYSLIELQAMTRKVIWVRSVRPVQNFFFNMVLGAHVVLYMTEPDFFKKMFYPQNGENRPSLGFFECIGKFRFFLNSLFFSQFGL